MTSLAQLLQKELNDMTEAIKKQAYQTAAVLWQEIVTSNPAHWTISGRSVPAGKVWDDSPPKANVQRRTMTLQLDIHEKLQADLKEHTKDHLEESCFITTHLFFLEQRLEELAAKELGDCACRISHCRDYGTELIVYFQCEVSVA